MALVKKIKDGKLYFKDGGGIASIVGASQKSVEIEFLEGFLTWEETQEVNVILKRQVLNHPRLGNEVTLKGEFTAQLVNILGTGAYYDAAKNLEFAATRGNPSRAVPIYTNWKYPTGASEGAAAGNPVRCGDDIGGTTWLCGMDVPETLSTRLEVLDTLDVVLEVYDETPSLNETITIEDAWIAAINFGEGEEASTFQFTFECPYATAVTVT